MWTGRTLNFRRSTLRIDDVFKSCTSVNILHSFNCLQFSFLIQRDRLVITELNYSALRRVTHVMYCVQFVLSIQLKCKELHNCSRVFVREGTFLIRWGWLSGQEYCCFGYKREMPPLLSEKIHGPSLASKKYFMTPPPLPLQSCHHFKKQYKGFFRYFANIRSFF